jgi:hypothetical protein
MCLRKLSKPEGVTLTPFRVACVGFAVEGAGGGDARVEVGEDVVVEGG